MTTTTTTTTTRADQDATAIREPASAPPGGPATDTLKSMLADALCMLERAQIIDFNGHMSARLPGADRLLINSGTSVRSALTPSDIVTITFDGAPAEGDAAPPMEFHIHTEIYRRRPDVHAIVHTHPLWSTLFSMTGQPLLPVTMQAAVIGEIRPFDRTASINTQPLGIDLANALGDARAVMLRSHGAVCVGADIVEAFVLAVYLEENARRQYLARPLGTLAVLGDDELETIGRNLRKPHLLRKAWDYHHAKLSRR